MTAKKLSIPHNKDTMRVSDLKEAVETFDIVIRILNNEPDDEQAAKRIRHVCEFYTK